MTWPRFVMPVVSVAVLTIVAILPWGMAADYRFVLPLLPIVAIYYWTLDRDVWLPEWAIFLVGLMLDVLTQGPLGYWALVYLVAYVCAVYASRLNVEGTAKTLVLFAGGIVSVTVFAWFVASFYFLEILDFRPYARGAGFAIVAAIIVTLALGALGTAGKSVRPVRLTRGD